MPAARGRAEGRACEGACECAGSDAPLCSLSLPLSLYSSIERENCLKSLRIFQICAVNAFIKNEKMKNLLHTRAPPLLPPLNALNINM